MLVHDPGDGVEPHDVGDAPPVGHHGQGGVGPAVRELHGERDRPERVPDGRLQEGTEGSRVASGIKKGYYYPFKGR